VELTQTFEIVTLSVLAALLVFDLVLVARRPHVPSMRESALWVSFYIALALGFTVLLMFRAGPDTAGEFLAGWATEYSLSVDNLFVFVIIMSRFAVPRDNQQKVLLVGIILSLILRGGCIPLGPAAVGAFRWVFHLFGAFLG